MAIDKANKLNVPFIVAGDLHDTKALLRGECVKAMIDTFKTCKVNSYVLRGNHDQLNERSEDHSLEFLRPFTIVVDDLLTTTLPTLKTVTMIPYHSDCDLLSQKLKTLSLSDTLIIHQGVHSANMGHYVQDKTSLPKEAFADFRVISGHYHARQDIKCGRPRKGAVGLFSYIGNPFSLNFGEANDPEKGFQILMDDGLLEFVPTNLRKHVVIERDLNCDYYEHSDVEAINPGDLVWFKVSGPRSELANINREGFIAERLGHSNYKLDLYPTDSEQVTTKTETLQDTEVLDMLIESLAEPEEQKELLKGLWREIV